MLFTDYSFILFVAIVFILYYTLPAKLQWLVLLTANLVFYAFSGWDNVFFILITIASIWFFGRAISDLHKQRDFYLADKAAALSRSAKKAYREKIRKQQVRLLVLCLILNLGILAVLKYANFTIANLNSVRELFGWTELSFVKLALPMGISFYTFQAVGYLIDVYRGKTKAEKNILRLALFVSFFPQLIQGPISRFDDLAATLFQEHAFDRRTVVNGLERILWGYFKKVVIADRLLKGVTTIVGQPDQFRGIYVLIGMLFYAIQLYADFTGGIDITIGIAQSLGIQLKENFQQPYFAKSIAEFWRRWHITMGTWFRDYLFYPISISRPMQKLSKFSRNHLGKAVGKRVPVYLSTLLVWFTTGLWHGASWNFIVWGVLNGVFIILAQEFSFLFRLFHSKTRIGNSTFYGVFQILRTMFLVSSLRILDCYRDVAVSFRQFGSIFSEGNLGELWRGSLLKVGLTTADYVVLIPSVVLLFVVSRLQLTGSVRDRLHSRPPALRYTLTIGALLLILLVGAYGIGYDSSQFIYNQF